MAPKLFTLEEARQLLPVAAQLLLEIQARKRDLDRETAELERLLDLTGGNGHLQADTDRARERVQDAVAELQRLLGELEELGVQLKGIEEGLLDFPSEREGRTVLLCWRQGEETIGYWHEIEAGFAGRQPL